jgi:hypothetical protein
LFLSVIIVDIVDALRRVAMKCGFCKKYHFINDKKVYQIKSMLSMAACIILSTFALANGYNEGWTMQIEIPIKRLPSCLNGFEIGLLRYGHFLYKLNVATLSILYHFNALKSQYLLMLILSLLMYANNIYIVMFFVGSFVYLNAKYVYLGRSYNAVSFCNKYD